MTAHQIDVKDAKWKMWSEVVGFKGVLGDHGGDNLGQYFMGLCDHMGIHNQNESKVSHSTNVILIRLSSDKVLSAWYSNIRQCIVSCLEHVINLANIDVMAHITKIAAVETTTVIWEYNPEMTTNHMFSGSLDVITAIHTLAIKVRYYIFQGYEFLHI